MSDRCTHKSTTVKISQFLCVLYLSWTPVQTEISSAVLDKQTGQLSLQEGFRNDYVAWANFTDDIKNSGWSYLEVTTSGRYNDSIQAYAAGAVEAAVSSELIYKHWMNTLMGYCGPFTFESGFCHRLKDYITTNLQWVRQQIEEHPHCPYWHQVWLVLLQLKGLEDGYNDQLSFPRGPFTLNPFGFLLFQMGGDLVDLEGALNKSSQSRTLGSGSCSALIKLLPGNKDLLVSHDTWNIYQAMLRILKKYQFAYRVSPTDSDPIPGGTQAFSSYPGPIFSGDDFYILSTGLVTLETSIDNSNPALWKFVQPTGAVMEWLRNIVANRLAASGKEWAEIFSKHNSGTYYEEVFNASGCRELVKQFGPWFSLDMNPRAQIFRRNQSHITDMDSMVRLMRYNNFKQDPLSWCEGCDPPANGENTISARSDLNPANGTYPFGALKQRPHGGTDMKVTSYGLWREFGFLAASGPTWDQVPAFQWSSSPYSDLMHMGHPDTWAFAPVNVTWYS
ncbi:putative phospholipase B-like 2 isoform X3 [Salvelinus fontinalis]|uniref:putative phospholipase B-like 2 isoform X3 n=1 Tax=Salvelinus fontinalis TaxID=8038 RepID=UPI002486C211|nr:putative phospholipase B-like 2 isoform X3 [Salvelinus fontinalis]